MGTTLENKLNCLDENNAYVNQMDRCKMMHDGNEINLFNCFEKINIKKVPTAK